MSDVQFLLAEVQSRAACSRDSRRGNNVWLEFSVSSEVLRNVVFFIELGIAGAKRCVLLDEHSVVLLEGGWS